MPSKFTPTNVETNGHPAPQEDNDEYIWTSPPFTSPSAGTPPLLNRQLQDMEISTLRCPICHELYRNAVSLRPCYHSFCSECIRIALKNGRKNMKRKRSCPVCRDEIKEEDAKAIVRNPSLQEIVKCFIDLRGTLRQSLARLHCLETEKAANAADVSSGENNFPVNNKRGRSENSNGVNNEVEEVQELEAKRPRRSGNKRKQPSKEDDSDKSLKLLEDKSKKVSDYNDNVSDVQSDDMRKIQEVEYPNNLETKLSSTSRVKPLPLSPRPIKMCPLPTPHYHGLKKAKLQEYCKKEGLSTTGNESVLKARHQDFITLWNSECDSMHPRSKAELVAEIGRREKDKVLASMQGGSHDVHMKKLKDSRKALGKIEETKSSDIKPLEPETKKVTSGNAAFDKKMDEGFKKLIEEARKRGIAKKKPGVSAESRKWIDGLDEEDHCKDGENMKSKSLCKPSIISQLDAGLKVQESGRINHKSSIQSTDNLTNDFNANQEISNHTNNNIISDAGTSSSVLSTNMRKVSANGIAKVSNVSTINSSASIGSNAHMPSASHNTPVIAQWQMMPTEQTLYHKPEVTTLNGSAARGRNAYMHSVDQNTPVKAQLQMMPIEQALYNKPSVYNSYMKSYSTYPASSFPINTYSTAVQSPTVPLNVMNSSKSTIGEWQCPKCTYLNEKRTWSSAKCEMCDTIRPSAKSSSG